jgi:hypothetical protein
MSIYIPPNCNTLESVFEQQIRLGIQGFPDTGKTWSSLTFPNPIVINLNRGLKAHQGRKDVYEVPFYKMYNRKQYKEAYIAWLDKEGSKLTSEQTLITDSLSDLHTAYHIWYRDNEAMIAVSPKTGKINEYAEFNFKTQYFEEIGNIFLSLKCHIVLICHEIERADKPTSIGQPGNYTGKIRPLITGQTGDTIIKDYSDWFRAHVAAKPTDYSKISPESLANWGMKSTEEFKAMSESFVDSSAIFYWQTHGDDLFNAKAGSLINAPKFIPANYQSLTKYMRKII